MRAELRGLSCAGPEEAAAEVSASFFRCEPDAHAGQQRMIGAVVREHRLEKRVLEEGSWC